MSDGASEGEHPSTDVVSKSLGRTPFPIGGMRYIRQILGECATERFAIVGLDCPRKGQKCNTFAKFSLIVNVVLLL